MKQTFSVVRQPSVSAMVGAEGYTLGDMFLDNVKFCYTVEDEIQKGAKIDGRTAIPCGRYRLTTSFSNRFQRVLPLVLDVPGFSGIRIHGGNRAEDSHGCILVGKVRTRNGVANCPDTVRRIIESIEDAADLGIETWLEIK